MPKVFQIVISLIIIIPLLILLASYIANILFNRSVDREVKELLKHSQGMKPSIIGEEDITGLPPCVQNWLRHAGVIGQEKVYTVRLKQKGMMRLKEDGPWLPSEAEQYFTVDQPGFIWRVKVKMAPALFFTGRDKYKNGHGEMLIKILSLVNIVNAKGPEIDQGTMLRYLAEMPWFPSGALSDYIQWEAVDSHSAKATMTYGGVRASGVFQFNDQGEVVNFAAKRYRDVNGKGVLTDWGGITRECRNFNGIHIPSKTDVIWKLDTGDFNWFRCEITEIEYNNPQLY